MSAAAAIWSDAMVAAALLAADRVGLGGIRIRSRTGPVRDLWLTQFRELLPPDVPVRKLPLGIGDSRLLGGIDLAATLQARRPVFERGLLAEVDGGYVVAVMAERMEPSTMAVLNAVIDAREVVVERDGLSQRVPTCFGIVALDEGVEDESAASALCDRLAFSIDLDGLSQADLTDPLFAAPDIAAARSRLARVTVAPDAIEALCSAALVLGVGSLRASLLAVRTARVAAALDGAQTVQREHLELAARLVLAPRATRVPASDDEQEQEQQLDPQDDDRNNDDQAKRDDLPLDDMVLEAAQAAIPPDLLARLQDSGSSRQRSATGGRQGAAKRGQQRGRSVGVRRGQLRAGGRLHILETLRAAAPWQALRRQQAIRQDDLTASSRILVTKEDFRLKRFEQRRVTSTIFVVDASGSSALQRLAEVKGAVELLLAECYIRRDEVALISFRGKSAELLLPPTRSLTRAKRNLAGLPGGGGTPLSAAIDMATKLALAVRSKDKSPSIVLMTDGRANVSRTGAGDRALAEAEALAAARQLRLAGVPVVVVDTSPRPQPQAAKLAEEMSARYVALPRADALRLSRVG